MLGAGADRVLRIFFSSRHAEQEDADLDEYVTQKALDGLYLRLPKRRRRFRKDRSAPAPASSRRCSARCATS